MTIGKNNKNFAYAITAGSSGSSTPSSVAITSDELANSASLKTMAGMNYYIPPNGDAIDLNNMTVREHLATIMLNFGCSLPIALLLWLFCGYFRTPAGYKRMLDAASIEKGNIKKIHDEIDTIIKKNGDGSSTNPQNPPIPQNLDTPIPTPLQENPHLNTNLPSSATATNPFSSQSMSPFQNDFSQNPFNQFPIPQDSPSIPRKQYSSNLTDAPEGNRQTGIKIPSRCSLPTNESDTVKISDEAQTLSIADMRQFDCGHINKDLCNPNSYATLIAPITAAGILAIIGSDADKRATMQVPVYKLDEYGVIPIADNKANYSKIHFTCDSKHKQAYASINDTSDTSGSKPLAIGTYIIPCQGGQYKQFQVGDFGKIMSFKQLPSSPPPTQTVPTGMAKVSLKPIFYNGGSLEIDDNANDVKCTVRNNAIYTGKDQTSPVHPGHYLVMEADEKSATNQYITVGSNGQITPANTPARIFNESNFPMKHRRINLARLNLNMLFTPNFSTGWPFPLGYNIDAELENIPKNIFDTSPELKSEHFENVLFNETLSNLDVISLSPDKNTPQHHKINLIRRDNSIVAYNSGSPSQTPALGTYLFPVWLNEKHTHYGFIKFNVGKDGVVVSDIQPAKTTCINNMELRTKASLVQIAQSNAKENKYVTGFQIQSDAMLNSDNVSSMPTHIYLRLDAIGNVYAYHDANNTCPLTQGTVYSIPYWDSTRKKYIHCKIFVAKGGRLEVLRDMSQDMLRNIKQLDGFANGTYALSRIHSTNQGVYYYDENFSFNLEVTGDKLSANSAEFQNGDYVVIGSGRNPIDWVAFKPDAKGVITLTTPNLNPNSNSPKVPVKQNPNSSPQSNLDSNPPIVTLNLPTSSAVTSPPLPNSTACIPLITSSNLPANPDSPKKLLKSELYQAIKANETKPVIAPAHLVGSSSTITTTFTLNVNGNVQASPAVASLDEGTYQINYKEQSYQIQIGRNGFLVETYTLSSDRTYKPLPLPNSNSFYIAELDQNGRYNSNNQFRCSHSTANSSIERIDKAASLNDGDYVVLHPNGAETGCYLHLGTSNSSLAENIQKLLLNSDPLASSNNNQPNFIGESYPGDQSHNAQLEPNSVALLADSTHFQSMPPNTNTQRITAITSTQSAERVPIHFAKNNQGSMFVFIGNDDKTVAPPGVYNIPLQGKNAHIQIEVGAYGWLIPTNMREQWKPLCLANHDLPANIPPFDVAAYGNAPIWVCAIEDGKYTDQWYLVQPKRDTENNLSLTCIGSNKAGIPLPSGNYICPNGNAPFRMAISANNGHVDDFRIIPSDAKQLNPGTLHSSDYTTIITNKEICAIPIKKVANDAFRYDRNDASMFEINGNTITSTNNVCLPNRLYLLADSKTRTTVYGWIDVLDEGVINNTSQQNTQPQPQNTPQPLNQNSSQVIPPPSQLDANSSQNTSPPK